MKEQYVARLIQWNKVHWHIHPLISCVRGYGQEKWPHTRLPRSLGCVHRYSWYCRSVRNADRHVVLTVIWSFLTVHL
jgi:hypothetical protein